MNNHDLQEFQSDIDAYPAPIANQLAKAVKKALGVSTKKDSYWIVHEDERSAISDLFRAILKKLKYPSKDNRIPLAKDISKELIPMLNILSKIDGLYLHTHAFPKYAETRQRWLGLKSAEITEKEISVGEFNQIPLWYALQLCQINKTMAISELLTTLNLNFNERLDLFASMSIEEYDIGATIFRYDFPWGTLNDITADQAQWAIKWADRLIELDKWRESENLLWPICVALIKANISVKTEWEAMLPIGSRNDEKFALIKQLLLLIPESRRNQVVTKRVSEGLDKVMNGLKLLSTYPSAELTQFILDNIDNCRFNSPKEIIEWISGVAEKSAIVKTTLDTYLEKQKESKVKLSISKPLIPDSYDDLSEIHQLQLEQAGIRYGAEEYPLDERIPFFASDKDLASCEEGLNFAQQLKIYTLTNKKEIIYDVFLYLVEYGTIFKAGTTEVVASVSQGSLVCKDKSLKIALQNALKEV